MDTEIRKRFTEAITPYTKRLAEKGVTVKPEFYYVTIRRVRIPFKDFMFLDLLEEAPQFVRKLFTDKAVL